MYEQHARNLIQPWVRETGAEAFRDVCRFVLLTIRMPLYRAVADFKTLSTNGEGMTQQEYEDVERSALFGYKEDAWYDMGAFFRDWYADLQDLWHQADTTETAETEMLFYLVRNVPGLGFVKAGFVLQLAWGLSGCIDTHNLVRFGIPERAFRSPDRKTRPVTVRRKCKAYNEMVQQIGGTEGLWDSWCNYVADNQPNTYASAEAVSRLHAEAFNLI